MKKEICPVTPQAEFERQLEILRGISRIAVVGMSPNSSRPSYEIGIFLKRNGYDVIPIHPQAREINGIKAYPNLSEALKCEKTIDMVDLFVAPERTPSIVEEAHALGIKIIWFQPGAENPQSESLARGYGMKTISGACTMAVLLRAGNCNS